MSPKCYTDMFMCWENLTCQHFETGTKSRRLNAFPDNKFCHNLTYMFISSKEHAPKPTVACFEVGQRNVPLFHDVEHSIGYPRNLSSRTDE